ncbi:sugar ABC transporter substrate-binding protein [Christensenella tenuis]|uniref:Sugar ABC transporter substrate-binding protein n=1 Tax=Christensenella tenuis TaxID=2763033 RepID=A0ABR7ECW9_9FIRM|nr:sugar ABC transporter substrate-binding protein [Christensenella tenuis]MBC5647624.1 sugar ABC transporter substrate-binding protein [Christensenella tenuis]
MKKKLLVMVIAIVLCAAFAVACSTQGPATSTVVSETPASDGVADSTEPAADSGDSQLIIGYNAYSDAVAFSKSISDNMQENADKIGAKLLKSDTEGDATTALQNVDTFLAQGADVIVDSTWVDAATQAMAEKCKEAGVPLISIDIPISEEFQDNSYFMGVNNYGAGTVTGEAAADYIKNNWDNQLDYILVSYTESTGEVLKQRIYGVIDAVRDAGIEIDDSNVVWVNPQSTDATVETKSLTTDFLTAHPDAKHILMCCVNDQAAMGMNAAVETSNRTPDCLIVGQGCDDPAIENLRKDEDNAWIGSTGYFPETYGNYVFDIIDTLMNGGTPEPETYVENIFITKENIEEFYPQ